MTGSKTGFWLRLLACVALAALLPATLLAQETTGVDERAAIEALLAGTLAAGYREKDIDKFLSAYAPEARIVNYVWGEIDRETLGRMTSEEFSALGEPAAQVSVLEASVDGAEALVMISLGTSGVWRGGKPVDRQDRYYLRLRKGPAGWLIFEQSYRADFKRNPGRMHGAPRSRP